MFFYFFVCNLANLKDIKGMWSVFRGVCHRGLIGDGNNSMLATMPYRHQFFRGGYRCGLVASPEAFDFWAFFFKKNLPAET